MSTSRPSPRPLDLDITIVSAKHLKNVNWRTGPLKPYVIFWTDPDRRLATKSDDSGSTRPVWNEQFTLPLTLSPLDSVLTLEIFHSKPLESAKPLVGILRFPIRNLVDSGDSDDSVKLRTFELRRPSGRPQGKIRLKLSIKERDVPDYHNAPQSGFYYSSAPPLSGPRGYPPVHSPPPPPQHSYGYYSDPYSGYYPSYFTQQQALPPPLPSPRPSYYDHRYNGAPSAPVDYAPQRTSRMGLGTGVAVGAVAGALGSLALEEGLKYEEEKIADRVETELNARDEYKDYRSLKCAYYVEEYKVEIETDNDEAVKEWLDWRWYIESNHAGVVQQLLQRSSDPNLSLDQVKVITPNQNRLARFLAEDSAWNRNRLVAFRRSFGMVREIWRLDMGLGPLDARFMVLEEGEYAAMQTVEEEDLDVQDLAEMLGGDVVVGLPAGGDPNALMQRF